MPRGDFFVRTIWGDVEFYKKRVRLGKCMVWQAFNLVQRF